MHEAVVTATAAATSGHSREEISARTPGRDPSEGEEGSFTPEEASPTLGASRTLEGSSTLEGSRTTEASTPTGTTGTGVFSSGASMITAMATATAIGCAAGRSTPAAPTGGAATTPASPATATE